MVADMVAGVVAGGKGARRGREHCIGIHPIRGQHSIQTALMAPHHHSMKSIEDTHRSSSVT